MQSERKGREEDMRKHWEGIRGTFHSAKQRAPLQNSISGFLRVFHAFNKWAGSFTGPLLKSPLLLQNQTNRAFASCTPSGYLNRNLE